MLFTKELQNGVIDNITDYVTTRFLFLEYKSITLLVRSKWHQNLRYRIDKFIIYILLFS